MKKSQLSNFKIPQVEVWHPTFLFDFILEFSRKITSTMKFASVGDDILLWMTSVASFLSFFYSLILYRSLKRLVFILHISNEPRRIDKIINSNSYLPTHWSHFLFMKILKKMIIKLIQYYTSAYEIINCVFKQLIIKVLIYLKKW